jgi:glycerate 2-kinase
MPRILIVPDKFKGTLTAQAAAALMAEGWRERRPADSLELLPMSDGGDGFGEVMAALSQSERRECETVDAAHRPLRCTWWFSPGTGSGIVESARVIGLALLPTGKYHPFELDTFGLGAVLKAAFDSGATSCTLGIGGSATNDGGFGLARALGWRFLDGAGRELTQWTQLEGLARVIPPTLGDLRIPELVAAVDVQNPFLGPEGATRIYGPQKGVREEDFPRAEGCLARMAEVVQTSLGINAAAEPGTGAAGGLGFGLRSFARARLESGFALFATRAGLEDRIRRADVVLTGEGAIDRSTLMGKGVGQVASLCRKHGVPCLALAGRLADGSERSAGPFARVYGIAPGLVPLDVALAHPERWLPRLATVAADDWTGHI